MITFYSQWPSNLRKYWTNHQRSWWCFWRRIFKFIRLSTVKNILVGQCLSHLFASVSSYLFNPLCRKLWCKTQFQVQPNKYWFCTLHKVQYWINLSFNKICTFPPGRTVDISRLFWGFEPNSSTLSSQARSYKNNRGGRSKSSFCKLFQHHQASSYV